MLLPANFAFEGRFLSLATRDERTVEGVQLSCALARRRTLRVAAHSACLATRAAAGRAAAIFAFALLRLARLLHERRED